MVILVPILQGHFKDYIQLGNRKDYLSIYLSTIYHLSIYSVGPDE